MESVRKQSIQSTAIQITGSVIGALSTIFIYPMDLSLYGIYGFLTNTASLLVPFISLGFSAVLLRYYPYFEAPEKKHHGFFGFIFTGYAFGIIFFTIAFALLFPWIQHLLSNADPQNGPFAIYILPITILYVVFELFSTISINHQRITVPAFFVFLMKLILPALFILCIKHYLDRIGFVWMICLYYICVILMMIYYLKKIGKWKVSFEKSAFNHPMRNQMFRFAVYSILGGASAILALRMDSILVTSLKGSEANGLFTLAIFISNVAFIPASALTDSLNAAVSSFSKKNSIEDLKLIYSKSSSNMLIPTLWISLCIYCGFLSLSELMPNTEKVALIHPVILWLLLARIADAATGVNHHILTYSRYYPIELYLLLLMAVLNISFNYIWIPKYGIEGAAFATFSSICIYNILKTILVYLKLRIHPISGSLWKILLLGVVIAILFSPFHFPFHPLLTILILSGCITILFLGGVYFLKLSAEFNQMIQSLIEKTLMRK